MKKIYLSLLLFCAIAINGFSQLPANWDYINGASESNLSRVYEAPLVDELPIIDGDIDEAVWDNAPWFSAQVVNNANSDWRFLNSPDTTKYDYEGPDDYNISFKLVHDGSTYAMLLKVTDDVLAYNISHNGYPWGKYFAWDNDGLDRGTGDGSNYHWWRMDAIEYYMAPKSMADTILASNGDARSNPNLQSFYNVYYGDIEASEDYDSATIFHKMNSDKQILSTYGASAAGSVDGTDYYIEFQEASFDSIARDVKGITTGDTLIFDCQADDDDSQMNARDFIVQFATTSGEARINGTEWVQIVLTDKSNTVGIETPESTSTFKLYPNPASNMVQMNTTTDVYIYNISGQLVQTELNTNNFNVSSLSQGVYFVKDNAGNISKLVVK